MKTAFVRLAPILFAALIAAACGRGSDERAAAEAVRAYDDALVVAYRTNDARELDRVAGNDEVRKLTALIDLKRNAGLALESELESFDVLGVALPDASSAQVRTRERWRYWDRPLRPGTPTGQVFVVDMWMAWQVGRADGAWKVLGGRTERSDYLEPVGYEPEAAERRHAAGAANAAGH